MKKKNIYLAIIGLLCSIILTGCGNKKLITTSEFISVSKNLNYLITDVTSQYAQYGYIKDGTIAQSTDGWQVEFYVLEDESYAINMFNTNRTTFESNKGNSSTESSASMGNYSSYTLTSNGYYMHLCRVENTLLYVKVKDSYQKEVKEFINKLGY